MQQSFCSNFVTKPVCIWHRNEAVEIKEKCLDHCESVRFSLHQPKKAYHKQIVLDAVFHILLKLCLFYHLGNIMRLILKDFGGNFSINSAKLFALRKKSCISFETFILETQTE
jgi:hypothetical protein